MIKYNLKCDKNHEFESWFSDSSEFEKLSKKKLLECIYCSSRKICKSIMAPMVSNTKLTQSELGNLYKDLKAEKKRLMNVRKYIEENFENVGDNFSKKVREIYYDKKNNKTIYGTTTAEERDELADEGIDLISVPWIEKDN
tara:strand:+ start:2846 stop:3268 length:423 start_codon:yes stop_codon:yes gene_type:complete